MAAEIIQSDNDGVTLKRTRIKKLSKDKRKLIQTEFDKGRKTYGTRRIKQDLTVSLGAGMAGR